MSSRVLPSARRAWPVVLLCAPLAVHSQAIVLDQIARLGLYDTAHTTSFGGQTTTLAGFTATGYAFGASTMSDGIGSSAWIANSSGVTTQVGLTGGEFDNASGTHGTTLAGFTDTGYAYGSSKRYYTVEGVSYSQGSAAWVASAAGTHRVGFFGDGYVTADGTENTTVSGIVSNGSTYGFSNRYVTTTPAPDPTNIGTYFTAVLSAERGQDAWIANASGVVTQVGLTATEYTRNDGTRVSTVVGLNTNGVAFGTSYLYDNGQADLTKAYLGTAAWVRSSGGTTTRVGLFSDGYTRSDGVQLTQAGGLNEAGYSYGISSLFDHANSDVATASRGTAAWIASGAGVTTRVGLYSGTEFIRTDTYSESLVSGINATGHSFGTSTRYSGSTASGAAAWVADNTGATTRVGFTTSAYTRGDGYQSSTVTTLNDGGYGYGASQRYDNLLTPAYPVAPTGPTDYAASDYIQKLNLFSALNAEYQAQVTAQNIPSQLGQTAWIVDASGSTPATIAVGLTGAGYTRQDGYQSSVVVAQTSTGLTAGQSLRYDSTVGPAPTTAPVLAALNIADSDFMTKADAYKAAWDAYNAALTSSWDAAARGQTTWISSAAGTLINVGLTNAVHTALNGTQSSTITGLSETFAWGYSQRYNGTDTQVGQTAFIYDVAHATQYQIELSVRASDQFASSTITTVVDINGLGTYAFGIYTLFDGSGISQGNRAFGWSAVTGAFDLSTTTDAAVASAGVTALTAVLGANASGFLVASATYGAGQTGVDLLQALDAPAIPEPSTYAAIAGALILGITLYRRRCV